MEVGRVGAKIRGGGIHPDLRKTWMKKEKQVKKKARLTRLEKRLLDEEGMRKAEMNVANLTLERI